jgi:hypothetical protein
MTWIDALWSLVCFCAGQASVVLLAFFWSGRRRDDEK